MNYLLLLSIISECANAIPVSTWLQSREATLTNGPGPFLLPFKTQQRAVELIKYSEDDLDFYLRKRQFPDLLSKRDFADDILTLTSSYNFHTADISVGTPAQNLSVTIDTASPYLWVYGGNTSFNNASRFDSNSSVTYHSNGTAFNLYYGAGYAAGYWAEDSVTFGNISVQDFAFGNTQEFTFSFGTPGLLGLGPGASPATSAPSTYGRPHHTLADAMYLQNKTSSPAFSYSLAGNKGDILIGGIQPDLLLSNLTCYNFPRALDRTQQTYNARAVSLSFDGNTTAWNNFVALDTGSPLSGMPRDFVDSVAKHYNLTYQRSHNAYYVANGTTVDLSGSITIGFYGNTKISIPVKDLFIPGSNIWGSNGPEGVKALSIVGVPSYFLGSAFFNNAYVVLDSYHNKLCLAPKSNAAGINAKVVEMKDDHIPYSTFVEIPGVAENLAHFGGNQ